jgi:hypothetical protein
MLELGREAAEEFGRVACGGFGVPEFMHAGFSSTVGHPGWRHYLAYDGDTPVATGALYVRNGIGWLGMGSTLAPYRRRGAQGAIMAERIRDGAEMGCRWLVTETGEDRAERPNPSYRNMIRTGFILGYQRPNYIFQE